jgi:hypothetical protein
MLATHDLYEGIRAAIIDRTARGGRRTGSTL